MQHSTHLWRSGSQLADQADDLVRQEPARARRGGVSLHELQHFLVHRQCYCGAWRSGGEEVCEDAQEGHQRSCVVLRDRSVRSGTQWEIQTSILPQSTHEVTRAEAGSPGRPARRRSAARVWRRKTVCWSCVRILWPSRLPIDRARHPGLRPAPGPVSNIYVVVEETGLGE